VEPFRAFVADKLGTSQRTAGFVMQSFFIGVGQTFANVLPNVLHHYVVTGNLPSGIPIDVEWSFRAGAILFLLAVIWTVYSTKETPGSLPARRASS
jgi:maltose/moltooligosaccharide transporter